MRLMSLMLLIVALISQGAVARIHLMPSTPNPATEVSVEAEHGHHGHQAHHASHGAHHAEPDCHSPKPPVADCCQSKAADNQHHDAGQPCNGDCGHCVVFSPAGVALPTLALPMGLPVPQRANTLLLSFSSVSLSSDSKPPIA